MTRKKKPELLPEWSHPVEIQDVNRTPMRLAVAPPEGAIKGLMKRLGLVALERLEADIVLERAQGGAVVHITGTIRAHVTQSCVVTLEPVITDVNETFEAWYASPEEAVSFVRAKHDKNISKGQTETPILDEKDDPEPTVDGKIDIGELVVQQLSLALEPYPRKEGAEFEVGDDARKDPASALRKNPFAALKDWKSRNDKGH